MVSSAEPDLPKVHAVQKIAAADIVDTNGAGDAFAGGFMGALVLGKSVDEAIEIGHKMGAMNLKEVRIIRKLDYPYSRFNRLDHNSPGQRYRLSKIFRFALQSSLFRHWTCTINP